MVMGFNSAGWAIHKVGQNAVYVCVWMLTKVIQGQNRKRDNV